MATSVSGAKSLLGVKLSEEPLDRQDPAVLGVTVGSTELLARGEDKVIVIGEVGETPVAPFAGTTETKRSAGGATLVAPVCALGRRPCSAEPGDVRWLMARVTSAPARPPAHRHSTIVVMTRAGERRPRAR